ncbi:MAG: hypothetical protein AB2598_20010 [Candidatus Thiodiazotropha sp.]
MSTNPLEKLVIDYWYKAIAVAGLFVLILSLTVELVSINNNVVQLISLGTFFVGLGEWVNHPLQTAIVPSTAYHPAGKLTGHPRNASLTGTLLDLLGSVLIGVGLYKLFVIS